MRPPTTFSGQNVSGLRILSAVVVLLVLIVQFWPTSTPSRLEGTHLNPFGHNVRKQEAYFDQLEPGTQCRPKSIFSSNIPFSQAPTNMALAEAAGQMAAEFDYPADEVQKGVREFIKEMDEGLEKQGTTLSQIPSYVTSVPNGTEKVRLYSWARRALLTHYRASILPSISAAPTFASAALFLTATKPSPSPNPRCQYLTP